MRTVFMGTPEFAVPTLERLVEAGYQIAAVYTQPDRPRGRSGDVAQSPVKRAALRIGVPVRQPERVRRPEVVEELAALRAEVMVVVGYGQLIPQSIIDLPPHGIINVHASLLPKYRGAAPIQWAVANGEQRTGVTTMRIDAGLDTGDMLLKAEVEIGPEEDAVALGARLASLGADLLVETLRQLERGALKPEKQNAEDASYAPILKKETGLIDWSMTAGEIYNRSRGFLPWPGTYTHFRGHLLHIWKAKPDIAIELDARTEGPSEQVAGASTPQAGAGSDRAGMLRSYGKHLIAICGRGTALELLEVQLEGRKRISADAFRNGQRLAADEILGEMKN